MGKNTKPMLTALMDGEKLQRLRDFASQKDVSMGWLINRLVDRLLAGDVDVMDKPYSIGVSRESIEKKRMGSIRGSIEDSYVELTRESIEEMIETSIEKERERVDDLINSYRENRETTSMAIEEIRAELSEVSEFTRNLQGEIAKVKTSQFEGVKESTDPTPPTQIDLLSSPSNSTQPEGALSKSELVEKLGKSRQSIEQRRDKGTLEEWGYRADKIGSNWYYFPLDQSNQPAH